MTTVQPPYPPQTGTVLVTAGSGKVGSVLVAGLRSRRVPVRPAGRTPSPQDPDAVRFDWDDPATYRPALRGADRVFLVPPPSSVDPLTVAGPFLAEARRAGVRRLVLLGSAIEFPGAPGRLELAAQVRAEPGWTVLRPSGFMHNFLPPHPLGQGIRRDGEIRTAAGDGRVGWIDVLDVAEVAAALLGNPDLDAADDYLLTGPQLLNFAEAAEIITAATGRPIRVRHLTADEMTAAYRAAGLPPAFAAAFAAAELATKTGAQITTSVAALTGRPAHDFESFVHRHMSELVLSHRK